MGMTAHLEGNITTQPELRYTDSGKAVCETSVADNRKWTGSDGVVHDDPTFVPVVFWQDMAENFVATCNKGDRIVVEGRIEQANWLNEAGEKRSRLRVIANTLGVSLRFATADVKKNARPGMNDVPTSVTDEAVEVLVEAVAQAKGRRGKATAAALPEGDEPF